MKNILKKNDSIRGITLIALVSTIIILLILAGISISMLAGENGILTKAVDAKEKTQEIESKEQIQLAIQASFGEDGLIDINSLNNNLKNIEGLKYNGQAISDVNKIVSLPASVTLKENKFDIDGKGRVVGELPIVTVPPTEPVAENTKYNDGINTSVIPKGFRVSDNAAEQTIETGLVVKDGKDNEWVWIPVDDVTEMYTAEESPYYLCGTTGVSASIASKSEILSGKRRIKPGETTSGYGREPDLLTQWESEERAQLAGFTNLENMAQSLVDDYGNMITSVGKYKGFYVGRYELTGSIENPTEKSGECLTGIGWYNSYKACKGFITDAVESRMIWGCQWDMVCKYIATDSNYSITDSRRWGNYDDSVGSAYISGKNGTKQNTGFSEYWSAKKMYDIAGNCQEWTQEAVGTENRAVRRRIIKQLWKFYSSFLS